MAADETNDVVVVGAGSSGLSVSHFLRQAGVDHVVLERGEIGESWRSQRWGSFRVNTPLTDQKGDTGARIAQPAFVSISTVRSPS